MSDEQPTTDAQATNAQGTDQTRFQIEKVYLKDVSFESPAAPGIFSADSDWQPSINLKLNTEQQHCGQDLFEVALKVTVTATQGERTAFLVEIQQAGLFRISGIEAQGLAHLLGSYCPSVLFPYAREVVGDLVQKGGLPPLVLQPINFDALYAQQQESTDATAETAAS
jgi:preprotein translocase subunit SecB